jgi:hypothetical protein
MRIVNDGRSPEPGQSRASTALVPVAPCPRGPASVRVLPPAAPFLAQLIATRQQAPQTRARRRAEPADASTAYRAGRKVPHTRTNDWVI